MPTVAVDSSEPVRLRAMLKSLRDLPRTDHCAHHLPLAAPGLYVVAHRARFIRALPREGIAPYRQRQLSRNVAGMLVRGGP